MRKLIFTVITCLSVLVVQGQQDSIFQAMKLFGLNFTPEKVDSLRGGLEDNLSDFRKIRMQPLPNDLPYSLVFVPPVNLDHISSEQLEVDFQLPGQMEMPARIEELAFYSVAELSVLLRTGKVTSLELTKMYLSRLKRFGDTLQCVVSLTEELAMEQAKQADEEIAAGRYRGPLHGIPYGVKDLLAVEGYKTTWGAMPFKDQEINYTATVVEKLEAAGAVLVAKLTLGALAWGDVWYGGVTKNPWNLEQGSSGSSAGPASAVAAGLVPLPSAVKRGDL